MNWGTTGILIVFGAFVLLMIFNPRLSCFGKRIRSPFYPLFRKKGRKKTGPAVEDYGFRLGEGEVKKAPADVKSRKETVKKTDDYGFRLD
ncbi:MAG: hypothetical protein WAU81_07845 [Candidatus Aminicenantales bacterium]